MVRAYHAVRAMAKRAERGYAAGRPPDRRQARRRRHHHARHLPVARGVASPQSHEGHKVSQRERRPGKDRLSILLQLDWFVPGEKIKPDVAIAAYDGGRSPAPGIKASI